jgi:integrase
MITTGLRGIEIIRAKKKDLAKMGNISILYVQGKGRQEADEFVKISQVVTHAFNDYLNLRSDNSRYLFVSHSIHTSAQQLSTYMLNKMMKENLKRAGISDFKLTIHSLRHTAATFNLLRGGSIEATQALLRHQSIETTMIYLHHINRVKDDSEFQIERYILDDSKKKESADESKSST